MVDPIPGQLYLWTHPSGAKRTLELIVARVDDQVLVLRTGDELQLRWWAIGSWDDDEPTLRLVCGDDLRDDRGA